MNCAEFQELAAALALGALEAEERAACERHLAGEGPHAGCEEALGRARAVAARLPDALPPVRPGDQVWRAIEARLRLEGSETEAAAAAVAGSRAGGGGGAGAPRRGRSWWPVAAVVGWAAAAAAAAALVWVWQGRAELEDAADEAERHLTSLRGADTARADCVRALDALRDDVALHRDAVALLAEPTTRVVAFAPQPGKASYRASAIVGAGEHGRAIVLASAVARASGKAYQLWVIRGKAPPVPAGFLRVLDGGGHGGGTGMAIGEIDPAVLGAGPADAFAVSLEPDGGSESPTEVLLVGALKG